MFLLWAFSSPRDRNAARIILLATLVSFLITEGITRQIEASWKLMVPATVESLTVMFLLLYARNRTGFLQAGLLCLAWLAHVLCYMDLMLNTDMVYSNYELVLGFVALGQLLGFHDTVRHNIAAIRDAVVWRRGAHRVRLAGGDASALHSPGSESL